MIKSLFSRKIDKFEHFKLRLKGHKNTGLILHKGCRTDISKSAVFNNNKVNSLELNKKWSQADSGKSLLFVGENVQISLLGSFAIFSGSRIYFNKNARIELGSGYINHSLSMSIFSGLHIGQNVSISENVSIRDSDNHFITGSSSKMSAPIWIGDHVWIGMNVTILKGVTIGNGSVIAAGTVLTKNVPENSLVAGVPGKIIKSDISWK